ncbi:CinA family protein [Lachnoclostridium phytofermentans]|uniref:CinA domain protein n=1 Tax=Lachnoclostridium phytofermentans (strain ATCC 700394 / DSM 18823 / ISDg) TaxID=357809 RepID=A9KLS0_LACP7|nr:nicotinamide-nucleotide amidohydrolase family protein [Lachnoclostridium phytofermentans]ABX42814.1 CinA domain protein [Lachnoclostridium phytofermentans ISDg]
MEYHIIHKVSSTFYDLSISKKLIQLIRQLQIQGFILSEYDTVFDAEECEEKLNKSYPFVIFSGFKEEEISKLESFLKNGRSDARLEQKTFGEKIEVFGNIYYLISNIDSATLELPQDMENINLNPSYGILSSLVVKLCGIRKSNLTIELEKLKHKDPSLIIATDCLEIKEVPKVCEGTLREEQFGEVLDATLYFHKNFNAEKESELWKDSLQKELITCFGTSIYSFSTQESLESLLIKKMSKKGLTLTAAESCTGGLFIANMINVSGASSVIDRSFVTYANEAKEQCLCVSHDTLVANGAVSMETAGEMARGAAKAADASVAVAITGIAGPLGGTPKKPVGTVYLSCYYKEKTHIILLSGIGSRDEIRSQTVQMAKILLLKILLEDEF